MPGTTGRSAGVDPEALWAPAPRPRSGRRPAHDRAEVVRAAVEVADAEGLAAVTMRAVAARVGTGTMSLYTYVRDKETLLELMIDHAAGEAVPFPAPTGDWRADLRVLARAQRALMLAHPWLPAALLERQTFGPNTLATLEHALAVLEPMGLEAGPRLEAFSLLTGFVSSHVGYELGQRAARERAGTSSSELLDAQMRYLRTVAETGAYPRLAAALSGGEAAGGAARDPDVLFERLLDRVINGMVPASP
ncbi:TetR/AcrR family transcriptional regulator [Spirillospora sp. NPDC050679]